MQSQVNWYLPCLLFLAFCCAVLSADSWCQGPITSQIKRRLALVNGTDAQQISDNSPAAPEPGSAATGRRSLFRLSTTEAEQRGVAMVLASAPKAEKPVAPVTVETLIPNPLQTLSESPLLQESPSSSTASPTSQPMPGPPALEPADAFVFSLVTVSDRVSLIPALESGIKAIKRRWPEAALVDPQAHAPDAEILNPPNAKDSESERTAQDDSSDSSNSESKQDVSAETGAALETGLHYVSWTGADADASSKQSYQEAETQAPTTAPQVNPQELYPAHSLKSPIVTVPPVPLIAVFPVAADVANEDDTPDEKVLPPAQPTSNPPPRTTAARKSPPLWPGPELLEGHQTILAEVPEFRPWLDECRGTLEQLQKQTILHGTEIDGLLQHLEYLTGLMDPMIQFGSSVPVETAELAQGEVSTSLRRLRYSLQQRLDIWRAVNRVANAEVNTIGDQQTRLRVPAIQVSTQRLTLSSLPGEWQQYLLLPELQKTLANPEATENAQRTIARRVLGRVSSPILAPPQQQYLADQLDEEWIDSLKIMARGTVDLPELLHSLEVLQKNGSGVAAAKLNHQYQNLLWNDSPAYYALAETIDTHFRNANLRLSISDELLNLMLPSPPDVHEPVNENILGANVRGQSRIANRLRIKLLPDPSQIKMRLESNGQVDSSTQASRSGFVIDNLGTARFQAFKQVVINRHGILTDRPQAYSNSNNQMVGMRSNFDGMPVIGWIARRMAQQQIDAQQGQAESIVKHRLESTVKQRFDSEIEQHLDELQTSMSQGLIQPLVALDLEPTPLELRTTDDRVVMRYRLAGVDQMAADTARPRGLQASLFSLQLHESALNNLLNRIELNGREFTAVELSEHLSKVFGTEDLTSQDIRDVDARLEFAPYDPIRISMRHDDIRIELNLRKFQIGRGKVYKNIRVMARYVPQVQGSQLLLTQDDTGISLESKYLEFRDQLAVRPVFNSLFKLSYQVDLVPAHLTQKAQSAFIISQFDVTGGWLGLSIDRDPTQPQPRVTQRPGPAAR